jgi:Rab-like protein 2
VVKHGLASVEVSPF